MQSNDEELTKQPPISLPENLQVQVSGFEEAKARSMGEEVAVVVRELSRYLPLNNLVGVMIAHDYASALANIDLGFGDKAPPPQATNDEELGHGAAMALSVVRDGIWKTHVVFGPYLFELLTSDKEGDKATGYKLVVHGMAHAADHEFKRLAFGEIWQKSIDELISDPKEQYLWERSHFIWDEYYASRVSVNHDPEGEPFEDELFASTYVACRNRLREARREYYWRRISLEEFLEILRHNLRVLLLAAGYLFGLVDGLKKDFPNIAPKSAPLLREDLGQAIMQFHRVLVDLWKQVGKWASYDEFLKINVKAEALLNDLDLYVSTTEDGQVYMDIPPGPEHVYPQT